MSHEVETMAFANEVPWHGLGNNLEPTASLDEWLVAAGLNWQVKMHPMFAKVGDEMVRVENQSALVRDSDNRILTTASDNWKPIQNRKVLEFFRDYARAGGATLETAGALHGGKLVWGLANLGHGFTTNNGQDQVKGYVLFASPHEKGKASSVRLTATRVVCANTMAVAMGDEETVYKQSHVNFFDFGAAKDTMNLAHESMVKMELNAKALEQLRLSEHDTVRFLSTFFQPTEDDKALQQLVDDPSSRNRNLQQVLLCVDKAPGAVPGNGWGVMNAVTYWADHIFGNVQDSRMRSAWFGENALLKQKVEKGLLELVA
jgi:phage/plasmid-like protein (TIGR03299 family)